MKIKSINFVARGEVELREIDLDPVLAPNEVLLKTVCTLVYAKLFARDPDQLGAVFDWQNY